MTNAEAISHLTCGRINCLNDTDKDEELRGMCISALDKQIKLQEAIPEMIKERNLCMEIIDEYSLTEHTFLENKAFHLCGAVMQTLGATIDMLEVEE